MLYCSLPVEPFLAIDIMWQRLIMFTYPESFRFSGLLAYLQVRCIPSSRLWFVALLDKCSGGNCNEPQNSTK